MYLTPDDLLSSHPSSFGQRPFASGLARLTSLQETTQHERCKTSLSFTAKKA
ncbi:unnamed protein product [Chondrus crispus]|uniref:Uncharacterized protein n=1 Tax=Chondrus crispus TaxID=2769 RepID=R7QAX4_CHOCR|nr:unnamed protein product [Chondrus crispus]CDF35224.1 unnamed protein product [Chondrus crispus]|eukprot:XP_005715043.1 unnamed protein product [Chondrus crispus]